MQQQRCPGFFRSIRLETYEVRCPNCGRVLEFFSDEMKLRCKCGTVVYRESQPTCAEWCPYADKCLEGILPPEQLEALKRRREQALKEEDKEFVERVKELCERAGRIARQGRR